MPPGACATVGWSVNAGVPPQKKPRLVAFSESVALLAPAGGFVSVSDAWL